MSRGQLGLQEEVLGCGGLRMLDQECIINAFSAGIAALSTPCSSCTIHQAVSC